MEAPRAEDFEVKQTITVEELDHAVSQMVKAKEEYDRQKAAANELYYHHENCKQKVMELLRAAGKKSYQVDDIGKVTVVEKLKVKMPQTVEFKEKLFNWLQEKHGQEGFLAHTTINYNTLNRLYNEEFEEATNTGNAADFEIPGLDSPETVRELRFNKARS